MESASQVFSGSTSALAESRAVSNRRTSVSCEWMDLRTLTKYAAISERTARDWAHRSINPMPAVQVGGKIMVSRTAFDTWMHGHIIRPDTSVENIVNEVLADLERK